METTDRSVSGIIAAFRASLQEFKSYRERKRKVRKESSHARYKALKGKEDSTSGSELKLSSSLRQGAVDVQREYDRHFRVLGDRYAVGDTAAHSSLGRTLRKLNTCLHNIISSLLSCGRKDLKVDYQYLTSVSELSRQEALEALSQLSYRMSQSALSLQQQRDQETRRKQRRTNEKAKQKVPNSKSVSDVSERSRQTSVGVDKKQPTVRMVHLKSASTPQLAMVRPKPRRSSSPKSDVSTSTIISPSPSPASLSAPGKAKHRRNYSDQPIPSTIAMASVLTKPPPSPPPTRRRQEKITPSVYTFASASTRLGEIPEMKWSLPYDHDAMIRLNQEHGGRPWPPPPEATKPKRGFFSLFKKSDMKTAEVAA